MKHGKYTVVSGKFVHSSDLSMVRTKQVLKGIMAAIVVVTLFYMALFCI